MMIVKTMIASAKSMKGSSYRKISRLNRGRKKMSQGGLKRLDPEEPCGDDRAQRGLLSSGPGRSRPGWKGLQRPMRFAPIHEPRSRP